MELLKLEIDKETKFLIVLNFFFLISIVSGGVIHHLLRDYISVQMGMMVGLFIGLGAMIGMIMVFKKYQDGENL